MRIGFITYWFNRGQAVIGRSLRDSFAERGHRTFVLARPTKDKFYYPGYIADDGAWNRDRVTAAAHQTPTFEEIRDWVEKERIEAIHCDQNYGFDALARIRAMGVRTVGRFVWEAFARDHVEGALGAFDTIYSFTRCEQRRYRDLGIDSPFVPFGCDPRLAAFRGHQKGRGVTFFYSGGFLSRRKPSGALVEAFRRTRNPDLRLVVKTQRAFRMTDFVRAETPRDFAKRDRFYDWAEAAVRDLAAVDPRIRSITDDVLEQRYLELLAGAHVCAMPSRWEGLGLHLYEAIALGIPLLVSDIPPVNEIAVHGVNAYVGPAHCVGTARSGIGAYEPDVEALTEAFERLADPELRDHLAEGARRTAAALDWRVTIDGLERLLRGENVGISSLHQPSI
jgi:1,2-diacylglycerol 3-alpha-glucosyltransferase